MAYINTTCDVLKTIKNRCLIYSSPEHLGKINIEQKYCKQKISKWKYHFYVKKNNGTKYYYRAKNIVMKELPRSVKLTAWAIFHKRG